MKKVGSENPMKASVVVNWSKNEYGRMAEYTPIGSATRRPRSWAEPRIKSEVGSRCQIRVTTSMRLTKENPQSPRSMDVNQRA